MNKNSSLFKSVSTSLALLLFAAVLQSCVDIDTDLTVTASDQKPLVLNNDSGSVTIPNGKHPIQLSIAKHGSDASEMAFKDLNQKFALRLPDAEKLLSITQPLVIKSDDLGQPVTMTLTREADADEDDYSIVLSSSDNSALLANAEFKYKSDTPAYDENSKSFLMSFQEVRRSQRGVLVTINGGLPEPMNGVVNHSAQALLAPWLYARYSNVQWFTGFNSSSDVHAGWADLIDSSPVVDFIAFDHGGADYYNLEKSDGLPWKKGQLRFVYTEGCESASSSYFESFLGQYGAAVAIGHRDTSASPFYAFPLVHSWTYGESALDSAKGGRSWGDAYAVIGNVLTFGSLADGMWGSQSEMLRESELGLAWTSEMTPDKLDIDTSAVLKRDTPDKQIVNLSFIDSYGTEVRHLTLTGQSLDNSRSNVSIWSSGSGQSAN